MDVDGDFLIVGSGIAALLAAAEFADAGDVRRLTKGDRTKRNRITKRTKPSWHDTIRPAAWRRAIGWRVESYWKASARVGVST